MMMTILIMIKWFLILIMSLIYVFALAYMVTSGILSAYNYFIENKVNKINNSKTD